MKEPYGQGPATQSGPESCAYLREGRGEALTGVRAGRVLSCESKASAMSGLLRGADAVKVVGRPHSGRRYRETRRDPAQSKTPSMRGSTLRGNREIPRSPVGEGLAGRIGKSKDERR
jgi:hypothetical protein